MCVGGVVCGYNVCIHSMESDIRWKTTLFYFKGLFTKSLMSDIKISNQIYRETLLSPYGHQSTVAAVTCSYNSKLGLRSDVRF